MTLNILYRMARSLPIGIQDVAREKVRQAGLRVDSETWLAQTLLVGIGTAAGGGILFYFIQPFWQEWLGKLLPGIIIEPIYSAAGGFAIGILLGWIVRILVLYYMIESRRKKVEEILPDFLLLVAGNIRAGMTSFSAFKSSTRPEFGPLSDEIRMVTTRSLGTESFGSALSNLSQKIKSRSLNETVRFFLQAVRSGGKVAQILENTATDLRRTQDLKKELESSTRTYVLFVAFVMVIATPLLMAVSVEFVELITRIQGQAVGNVDPSVSGQLGFLGGTISITASFLEAVAYVLLAGNAVLAGIFMGTISTGKPLLGLRFTPLMFVVSIVVFWLSKGVLGNLLAAP